MTADTMTTNATNAERMHKLDDAWNARDWDALDAYHDGASLIVYWPGLEDKRTQGGHDREAFDVLYSTTARWKDGKFVEEYLFDDNGTFPKQRGLA
jgi:hypothetical protein